MIASAIATVARAWWTYEAMMRVYDDEGKWDFIYYITVYT